MSRYRKKPVVIEAFKWTGDYIGNEGESWMIEAIRAGNVWLGGGCMRIKTLEGVMNASAGDWIIKGVKGEIYPCKPDIFEATYEPA